MKKIKLISAIGLFIMTAVMFSSSTFAQSPRMMYYTYYVIIHPSGIETFGKMYLIEITDQYGHHTSNSQVYRLGQYVYEFKETVPASVSPLKRVAHFTLASNHGRGFYTLQASPDVKIVSDRGSYAFNLFLQYH